MSKKNIFFISGVAGVLVLLVGAAALLTWEIERPTAQVEKVIPDERFPR